MAVTDKPTHEIVLLVLVCTLAATVLLTGAGIFIVALIQPERDTSTSIALLGNVVASLLGAVLGYMAGRGRREG